MLFRTALSIWVEGHREILSILDLPQFVVFDKLSRLVGFGVPDPSQVAWVISEHYLRGEMRPVVLFERFDLGIVFFVRHNSLDWLLSVSCAQSLSSDRFAYLFRCSPPPPGPGADPLHAAYFEGFPKDFIFGYYENNHRMWSARISQPEALWMTIFECMVLVDGLSPAHAWGDGVTAAAGPF